jgi:hypothetical protein
MVMGIPVDRTRPSIGRMAGALYHTKVCSCHGNALLPHREVSGRTEDILGD